MKTLVTGGEGFVGAHLIDLLVAGGHDVTASALGPASLPPSGGVSDEVEWTTLDVLDKEAVHDLVATTRPDVVFHLAGFSSAAKASQWPAEALDVNAGGTLSVVTAVAAGCPAARIVVTGSADVYGNPGAQTIDEDAPVKPISDYGVSKAAQELVALGVGRSRGVDVRVARLFPMIGPGQADAFVVPSFCRQAAAIANGDSPPPIRVGNLEVERDFTDVRDGAAALLALSLIGKPKRRVYNVCSGEGTPVRQVLEWILEYAGIDPEIVVDPERVRSSDAPRIVGSSRRLRDETGWDSLRDVREGVGDVYSWVQRSNEVH